MVTATAICFLIDHGANNEITNNYIHHVDLNGCCDAPLRLENLGDMGFTTVTYNTIFSAARISIALLQAGICKME